MPTTFPSRFAPQRHSWLCIGLLALLLCWQSVCCAADQEKGVTAQEAEVDPKAQAQAQLESSLDNLKVIEKTMTALRREIDNSKKGAVLNRATIRDGLELISSQIKEVDAGMQDMRNNIADHAIALDKFKTDLSTLRREISTNAADVSAQKYLIENYAAGGYETLLKIADIGAKLEKLSLGQSIQNDQKQNERISMIKDLDRLWLLLAIVLVSLAPVAFALSSNREHYKPLLDGTPHHHGVLLVCLCAFLSYFILGFGLMFGPSAGGWLGSASYVLAGKFGDPNLKSLFAFAEFLLYQTGFVLLAALIIYTAVGRQLSAAAHLLLAAFVGSILVPVFGHWAWAGRYLSDNKGWLESVGFIDAGGATIIHSMAAWFALGLVWKLGAQKPPVHDPEHPENEPVYLSSALFFLSLSMLGFTTGTLSIASNQIAATLLNIGLAASAGGFMALLHYRYFRIDKGQITRGLGGFATGLVAVAASAPTLAFTEALVVGAMAGILHNTAFNFLRKHLLKQVWQVRSAYLVATHGAGGVWGSVCVALFGTEGLFAVPSMSQLGFQLMGIFSALFYGVLLANGIFLVYAHYRNSLR